MPYRYLDNVTTADVAFEAWGDSLEAMAVAAAHAVAHVMFPDLDTIASGRPHTYRITDDNLDLLFVNFLEELIFAKDARRERLKVTSVSIHRKAGLYVLDAAAWADPIAPGQHPQGTDVKAVTLHRFSIRQLNKRWRLTAVLDV